MRFLVVLGFLVLFVSEAALAEPGKICRTRGIIGEKVDPIPGKLQGCGLSRGVRVHEVAGVSLSRPAVMDCGTAKALNKWVKKGLNKSFKRGKSVTEIRVAAGYACRTRNSQKGAKISEHGRGKAIDISGFVLKSGEVVTVLEGWNDRAWKRKLRKAWKKACGTFGTVLGPNADRFHKDHFHFDTAKHRGGSYCR